MCFFCNNGHILKGTRGEENRVSEIFLEKNITKERSLMLPNNLRNIPIPLAFS
jgi:hypothetical protein